MDNLEATVSPRLQTLTLINQSLFFGTVAADSFAQYYTSVCLFVSKPALYKSLALFKPLAVNRQLMQGITFHLYTENIFYI